MRRARIADGLNGESIASVLVELDENEQSRMIKGFELIARAIERKTT